MMKNDRFPQNFSKTVQSFGKFTDISQISAKLSDLGGAKVYKSCRSQKMLQNELLDGKIGVDTAENEPSKVRSI